MVDSEATPSSGRERDSLKGCATIISNATQGTTPPTSSDTWSVWQKAYRSERGRPRPSPVRALLVRWSLRGDKSENRYTGLLLTANSSCPRREVVVRCETPIFLVRCETTSDEWIRWIEWI